MHKVKIKKFLLSIFLCFLSLLLITTPTSAIGDALRRWFAENNIIFYDPESESSVNPCTPTSSVSSKPSGKDITWIGDSYSVGAKDLITEKFGSDVDFGIGKADPYIQVGKFVSKDGNEKKGGKSGLTLLKEIIDHDELRPYLIFALGTNGGWTESDMDEFTKLLSEDTTAILVNSKIPSNSYDTSNALLQKTADEHKNIYLADWVSVYEEKFFDKDPEKIHPTTNGGYKAWVNAIYKVLPGGTSAGLVDGTDNLSLVWNFFVNANIPGVSDNAAVIAGIIGNLKQESGDKLDPFAHTPGSIYYGIFQSNNADFIRSVEAVAGSGYWGNGTSAPSDLIAKAIQVELEWITQYNSRWQGEAYGFINNLDKVSKQTPEAYSDLFLVAVEGAIITDSKKIKPSNLIQDQGVLDLAVKYFGKNPPGYGKYYQEAETRRNNARAVYDQNANSAVSNTMSSSNSSNSSSSSTKWNNGWIKGLNIIKEDANDLFTDETPHPVNGYTTDNNQPNKILLHSTEGTSVGYAAYPAGNKFPAHFTVDLKKKTGSQHFPLNQPSLAIATYDRAGPIQIEIVGFSTGHTDSKYNLDNFTDDDWDYLASLLIAISEETGIPLTSTVNWANPNRLPPDEFLNYSGILGHMNAPAPNNHSDPGDIWKYIEPALKRGGGNVSSTTNYRNTSTTCSDSSIPSSSSSNNYTGDKKSFIDLLLKWAWPNYDRNNITQMPDYTEYINNQAAYKGGSGGGVRGNDCGAFVSNLIIASGWDPSYSAGPTGTQNTYLQSHWNQVPAKNTSDLQLGDVGINSHHVIVFVGEVDGFNSNAASASLAGPPRAPMANGESDDSLMSKYTWYRRP